MYLIRSAVFALYFSYGYGLRTQSKSEGEQNIFKTLNLSSSEYSFTNHYIIHYQYYRTKNIDKYRRNLIKKNIVPITKYMLYQTHVST